MQRVAGGRLGAPDMDHLEPVLTAEEVLERVRDAIERVDAVRDHLTDLYRVCAPGTVPEVEVGDALQAVRAAMKRLRKAREEMVEDLMTQGTLPGM